MGVGHASGKNKMHQAVEMAIKSPLLETSISGARNMVINFSCDKTLSLNDINEAATLIQEALHPEAEIIFGASVDESFDDEVLITLIATDLHDSAAPKMPSMNMSDAKPLEKASNLFAEIPVVTSTRSPYDTGPKLDIPTFVRKNAERN